MILSLEAVFDFRSLPQEFIFVNDASTDTSLFVLLRARERTRS